MRWHRLQHDYPQVLVIPEHSFTSVAMDQPAPYGQLLTYDFVGTPASNDPPSASGDVLATYPNAFSVIYPADGDGGNSGFPHYYTPIEQSVSRGDIILFRGWFNDAYNTTMVNIYDQAFPSLPPTPTGLSATAVAGVINLSWTADSGAGIFGLGTYNIKRSTTSGGPYTTIASGVMGTTYTDTSAVKSTPYYYVVSAVNGRGEGANSAQMTATTSTFAGPTVVSAAHADNVGGATTVNLIALGAAAAGESTLTYTWSSVSTPPNLSQPTYSANGTNAAKYVKATFHQAGTFTFTVTMTDANHLSITSSVTVVVSQVFTGLSVTPANAAVAGGNTQPDVATGIDQFGNSMAVPTVTWSVSGGGTIDPNSGIFSASQTGGTYTITATSGSILGTTGVTVVPTVFTGSAGNDTYTLRLNPLNTSQDQLVVSIFGSGTVTYNITTSQYPSLTISPSSGDDSLTVDFANGNPLPAGGVNFNGGTNNTGDALYISGLATGGLAFSVDATKVTYTPAPTTPITYSNLEKLEFDLLGGSNSLTQLAQPSAPLTFNAGPGNNTLTVNGGSYSFTADPQTSSGNLTVNDNSAVVFTSGTGGYNARHLAALNLGSGATVTALTPNSLANRTILVLGGTVGKPCRPA